MPASPVTQAAGTSQWRRAGRRTGLNSSESSGCSKAAPKKASSKSSCPVVINFESQEFLKCSLRLYPQAAGTAVSTSIC